MRYRRALCCGLLLAWISLNGHARDIEVVTEESFYAQLHDGRPDGPGTRVVEKTLQAAGLDDYRIMLYPWPRAYEKALREACVLIYPLNRTPAREALFKWVGEIDQATTHLYKLRASPAIVLHDLADARQYNVGVVRNDSRQLFLQQQGFTRLVVSDSNRDNFQKLLNHQTQLLPMPENAARALSQAAQVDFAELEAVYSLQDMPVSVYMAFSLDTPDDIVARARRAFEQLQAAGEVARIMQAP